MRLCDLKKHVEQLKTKADELANARQTAAWWCVSGYEDVLSRAIQDIERHQRRAVKVYKDRAIKFDDLKVGR